MSLENRPQNHEQLSPVENSQELLDQLPERAKDLQQTPEKAEQHKEQLELAREKIEQAPQPEATEAEKPKPRPRVDNVDKQVSYNYTMQTLHRHMPTLTRNFSKFIHTPSVEKVSDVASVTVFRPSVTLGATTTAFIVGAVLYISAKQYGYYLPGSQFIIAIIVGGLLGAVIELSYKTYRKLRA